MKLDIFVLIALMTMLMLMMGETVLRRGAFCAILPVSNASNHRPRFYLCTPLLPVSDVDGENDDDDDDMLPKCVPKTCDFTHAFYQTCLDYNKKINFFINVLTLHLGSPTFFFFFFFSPAEQPTR
jgi:hypothetical protein